MPAFGHMTGSFWAGTRPGAITNPNLLPNLQVWYDCNDATTFNPNGNIGTAITQWSDKSNFGHNAKPGATATRPVIQTNSAVLPNRVLRFDGVNDLLTIGSATWLQSLSGYTSYCVMKFNTITNNANNTVHTSDTNGMKLYANTTGKLCISVAGGVGSSTTAADTTNFHIYGLIYDGTATGNADRAILRYSKTQLALTFTGTVGATANASTTAFDLMNYQATEHVDGDLCEIIFWTRKLNSNEIGGVEDYLSAKWGVA